MKNGVIYTVETDDKILCFYKSKANPGGLLNKETTDVLHVSYFNTEKKAENAREAFIRNVNFLLSKDCLWFNKDESKCDKYELEALKLLKAIQQQPSSVQVVCRTLKIV